MSTSSTSINLVHGQTYTVNASNQRIAGADGTETVVIPNGFWNTVVDATVEHIALGVGLFATRARVLNGQLVIAVPGQGTELMVTPAVTGTQISYSDGSVATFTRAPTGVISVHYDTVNLPLNSSIDLPNGDVVVHGAAGYESLKIAGNLRHVLVDAAIENISIGVAYSPSLLVPSAGQVLINDAAGVALAQLNLSSGHAETLNFTNARGTLSLGSGELGSFTLTDLLLDANQTYATGQSNLHLYGNGGTETVTLLASASNETIDARVEKVILPSAYGSYTIKTGASDVQILNASNNLVADVFVAHNATGTQLQFANATYTASYTNGVLGLTLPSGTVVTPGTTNAPNGLNYSVSWGSFGNSQSGIQACLNKAMTDLGKYFNAKGVLNLQVLPETVARTVLAETSPSMVVTSSTSVSTEFQLESTSGTDSNGSSYDAVIYVNLANLSSLNLEPGKAPTSSQYDLATVLEHELLHAMGFTGDLGISTSVLSAYDSLVRFTNGTPYFVGSHAQQVYGGPVPLAPSTAGTGSAYYHVNVPGDLMNEAIGLGQVRSISSLDLAMLQDIGDPVLVGVSPAA